jgi:D-lactate dehydrogenase
MIEGQVAAKRIISDPLRTLAYGNDASFYRLVPKIVIKAENEEEVAALLRASDSCRIPVTFRAAGTSLSGQAVTDSVLIVAGGAWRDHEILDDGRRIRLQPGVIGRQANSWLKPFGKKIGPDPASINAAMIGGIAANNASGMCCGTSQNSYRTVSSMRLVMHDGTVLDTASAASRLLFRERHPQFIAELEALGRQVKNNSILAERIRHKFKIKNTTGYSLNALVDYADPFDIMVHLMIGSEGTLGFIAEIVYDTVEELPSKASALAIFPSIRQACLEIGRAHV